MLNNQFEDKLVEGVQEVRSLFRIYPLTEEGKTQICEQGFKFRNRSIKCYMQNPYVTGLVANGVDKGYEEKPMIKVTVKDLYKSIAPESIHHMLTKVYKLDISIEDIKMGNHRDNQGHLSELCNYDRYFYIHPDQLKLPLPRNAQCGTFRCRIYHKGQFGPSKKCFRCFREDHVSKNCTNPRACRVCLEFGHVPGSPDCHYYTTNHNLRPFGGGEDPMSNHYESEFIHNHIKMKSVEHGWFHQKSLKNGQTALAHMCLNANTAKDAKYLSQGIRSTSDWDEHQLSYELMKDLNRSKYEQVQAAKDALYECWANGWQIVEAVSTTRDTHWGSGLSKEATIHTRKDAWPGSNTLGKILTELSIEFFGDPPPQVQGDWSEEENDDFGFAEMGTPVGEYHYESNVYENLDVDSEESLDSSFTNIVATHGPGNPNWSPRPMSRGRGRGIGRGRGSRHAQHKGGRTTYSSQYMTRSPSVKRQNTSPLYSDKTKVQKPVMVQSKFANWSNDSKYTNGSFKVK